MRTFRIFGPAVLTAMFVCLPMLVAAATIVPGGDTGSSINSGGSTGATIVPGGNTGVPIVPGGNTGYQQAPETCNGNSCSVQNPLRVSNFCDLLRLVLNAAILIGLPVAVVFLVLVGLKYVTAYGDPGKIGKAHEAFLWTCVGIAVFLGAWTIAEIIKATLQSLGVTGFGSC